MDTDKETGSAVRQFVRSAVLKTAAIVVMSLSAAWLVGYALAVSTFAGDYLRDLNFHFLAYPHVKFYRVADPASGALSGLKIDPFSVADGETGVEYNEMYIPCWAISLGAIGGIGAGAYCLSGRRRST